MNNYTLPDPTKPAPVDKYWEDMERRAKERRDWEDRGEPVGK